MCEQVCVCADGPTHLRLRQLELRAEYARVPPVLRGQRLLEHRQLQNNNPETNAHADARAFLCVRASWQRDETCVLVCACLSVRAFPCVRVCARLCVRS